MTRKKRVHTARERIVILKENMLERVPVSKLCKKYGIQPSTFYGWRKKLFDQALLAFGDNGQPETPEPEKNSDEAEGRQSRYDPIKDGPICIPEENFNDLAKIAVPYKAPEEIRREASILFGDPTHKTIQFNFKLDKPYPLQIPKSDLNELGLPEKELYTTADVCEVLGLHQDTFRYRLRTEIYPEPKKRSGDKRRFRKEEVVEIVRITKSFPAQKWRLKKIIENLV